MGFLTMTHDRLGASIYTETGLQQAQEIWRTAIERYDPGWLNEPQGKVGELFRTEAGPAANELIELAWMLRELSAKLTVDSVPKFARKVRQLLREAHEQRYEELKAELGVGCLLTQHVSPLAFEPYDPPDAERHDAVTSPDYAFKLPDTIVAVEVTVVRVGEIERWERLVHTARESLMRRIGKVGANTAIELNVPLEVGQFAAGDFVKKVAAAILSEPSGKLTVPVGGGSASVEWRPIPRLQGSPTLGFEWTDDRDFAAIMSSGEGLEVVNTAAMKVAPIIDGERYMELVYKALRNTLRAKRKQFGDKGEAYLLALQPGHYRLPHDLVEDTFVSRVWPNPKFAWITGLALHYPRRTYAPDTPDAQLVVNLNPNAARPASPCLRALLDQQERFHQPPAKGV